jgi:tetratricopeptide (TPR) repeat protein
MEIPKVLIDQIKEGQIVLFLGAGASIGAVHPQKKIPPTGKELAELIAGKFLGSEFRDRPLSQVSELAISETDIIKVQEFIASIFRDFYPADFHMLIPKFIWSAIATTNFDLIIERAYDQVKQSLQQLVAFRKNGERVQEKLKSPNSVAYLKLHGCITDISDPNVPLILTPDQYVTHKKGRSHLFDRLQILACDFPFLFVGHSLSDLDIRTILLELSALGDARPRSYLLAPEVTPSEIRFWEGKKIQSIQMSFKDFLIQLNDSIPESLRILSTLYERVEHPIFKRFRVPPSVKPSESLMTFLTRDSEYIHRDYKTTQTDPKTFYKGYFIDWSPIVNNLDIKRSLSDNIMSEVFLITEEERSAYGDFYLIKGHAGSGKTVILRRIAWDASVEFDKLCLSLKQSSYPDYDPLTELHRLCNERIFLFIDPVNEYLDIIENFILRARKDKLPLTIIGAERNNEWNTNCEHLEPYVNHTYEVKYLTEKEIELLIEFLAKYKSLGHLEGMTFQQQKEALSKKAGRQLLVALHEATLGKPFSDIVFDEYQSIGSPQAQSLYLTVSIMHRLGVPTRAGLISRVHGIPFNKFKQELFKPLEFIVFASKDDVINDYVYRSRHSHIAEIVFERVLKRPQDRYDEYVKIISALDTDYNSDREAFKKLINAKSLLDLFADSQMIRQIYDAAKKRVGDDSKLLQQEAIFEMNSPGGSLLKATNLLQKAHKQEPYNKAIAHSLSELALKKAEKASTPLERNKLRQESRMISHELVSKHSITPHPYHTLIKIGLDELSELMDEGDSSYIEKKIKEVEEIIAQGMQSFPDEALILTSEAELSTLLNKNPKALESLKKAFSINKRNPFIASRLAKLYEFNNQQENAINVLNECLEANPNDKHINFKLATLLVKSPSPNTAEIKHLLRRSFTEGDNHYAAQFWFARFIYLERDLEGAFKIFRTLGEANIDIRIKRQPRGVVKDDRGPLRFTGTVSRIESSYAFIIRDGYQDRIFTYQDFNQEKEWDKLTTQGRVSFQLAFNYRGPCALNITEEEIPV